MKNSTTRQHAPRQDQLGADKLAARQFLSDLGTLVTSSPYQQGGEATALESLWKVFDHARDAIKENPGCDVFAARTTRVLNRVLRPLTAKWHRALMEGRLNGRDGADEFRGELQGVQQKLHKFATALHRLAYGKPWADALRPAVMSGADLKALLHPLAFGFTTDLPELKAPAPLIAAAEGEAVAKRRALHDATKAKPAGVDAIGLALSGGGIRSATFSLGVVQVLAAKGFLPEVDFLSTVSGGGYTGCFLTQRLGSVTPPQDVANPHGPDPEPEPVRYVRQHARYLEGNFWQQWGMVTATLAGMMLNWTLPLAVILGLALAASLNDAHGGRTDWPLVLGVGGGLSALAMVIYGLGMRGGREASQATGYVVGALLAFTGIAGVCWLLEAASPDLLDAIRKDWGRLGSLGAVVAALAAAAPGIIRFLPVLQKPKVRKAVLKVMLALAGLLVPLAAVLLFYALRGFGNAIHSGPVASWVQSALHIGPAHVGAFFLGCAAVVCALLSLFVININLTAPHRLYRDCLARTFIQSDEAPDETVKLTDINQAGTAPYHLINTTLNIPASKRQSLKERGCDFFLFSQKWTGSPATGYRPTEHWKTNGQPADLATAMAVSGAAFSTHMGLANMPTLTAILTLLNVRLGFWIRQQHKPGLLGFPKSSHPGFACLLREMTGLFMSEEQRWLNLSDGGHIENLGIYELLRRRCKFIVCVDGEADSTYTFQGLMTLVRHAQIDFGVRIEPKLDDLRPEPKTGYSKCHFHLCRIHYPEGIGLLLYLKLSVTGNESELIRRYRINNPDFPHQSTLDQFFDQEQFEAYRQLGVHVAEGLFKPALMDRTPPQSVPAWFKQLAKNLLEPLPKT